MSQESKQIIVFNKDEHIHETISGACASLGMGDVKAPDSAKVFFENSDLSDVSMVIINWTYEDSISPPAIITRIRNHDNGVFTPIVVIAEGQIEGENELGNEFFSLTYMGMNFTGSSLKAIARKLSKEEKWYRDYDKRIMEMLSDTSIEIRDQVSKFLDMLKTSPDPAPIGILIARHFFNNEEYKAAERILQHLSNIDPKNISALNELAKVYIKDSRSKEAHKLLKRAQLLNPHNTQRLCSLGRLELKMQNMDAAEEAFQKAHKLDQEDKKATFGIKLAHTMKEQARRTGGKVSIAEGYASLLNTIGISMIREGKMDEALQSYQQAYNYLNSDLLKSKVSFNIALGLLRNKVFTDAHQWFMVSEKHGKKAFSKARPYVLRLNKYFEQQGSEGSFDSETVELGGDEVSATRADGSTLDMSQKKKELGEGSTINMNQLSKQAAVMEDSEELDTLDLDESLGSIDFSSSDADLETFDFGDAEDLEEVVVDDDDPQDKAS